MSQLPGPVGTYCPHNVPYTSLCTYCPGGAGFIAAQKAQARSLALAQGQALNTVINTALHKFPDHNLTDDESALREPIRVGDTVFIKYPMLGPTMNGMRWRVKELHPAPGLSGGLNAVVEPIGNAKDLGGPIAAAFLFPEVSAWSTSPSGNIGRLTIHGTVTKSQAKYIPEFPHKCPKCAAPAYVGAYTRFECSLGCHKFV